METFMLWLVGLSMLGALISFIFTDTTQPPSGGDDQVSWSDQQETLDIDEDDS